MSANLAEIIAGRGGGSVAEEDLGADIAGGVG